MLVKCGVLVQVTQGVKHCALENRGYAAHSGQDWLNVKRGRVVVAVVVAHILVLS